MHRASVALAALALTIVAAVSGGAVVDAGAQDALEGFSWDENSPPVP